MCKFKTQELRPQEHIMSPSALESQRIANIIGDILLQNRKIICRTL